jgi:hypothetical protein
MKDKKTNSIILLAYLLFCDGSYGTMEAVKEVQWKCSYHSIICPHSTVSATV